ncbi:MAG: PDZ domain-containing protein, partial [Pseudomonadota bacterium]
NSGGPLFNLDGQVIGVNTAIISPSGGSIGIGFAVPSNLAANVVGQLKEFGETRRGWLGVRIQEVNDEMSEALGLEEASGALVASVTDEGPAQAGGIQAGDVILQFDGREVETMRDLPRMVAETPVGKTVRVLLFRKGKTQTVRVKLGRLEGQEAVAAIDPETVTEPAPEPTELDAVGLSLAPITDAGRAEHSLGEAVTGVLVTAVTEGGAAAEKGITAGDVIVEIGQEPVTDPDQVADSIDEARAAGRAQVLLLVQSGEDLRFVPLAVGE